MKKYRVIYAYSATGMEGRIDINDYGIVEAESEQDARYKIGLQEKPINELCSPKTLSNYTVREWLMSSLHVFDNEKEQKEIMDLINRGDK